MRWLALVPIAVFAAFFGFVGYKLNANKEEQARTGQVSTALPSVFVDRPAPALSLEPLPGLKPLTSDILADGRVKLVNFWASWCVPCRVEHPQLETLSVTVPVFGVNYKDQRDGTSKAAMEFLSDLGNPFAAIGADITGRTGIDWGLTGVPETFVIDGEGIVRLRFAGPITVSVMNDTILPAIEAAQAN